MKQELNCIGIEQRLIEHAEGNLPEDLAQAFALHLESCSACAELVAEASFLFASKSAQASEKAPDSLWRAIQTELNRIDEGRQKQPPLLSTRRPFVTNSLRTLGATAALLLGIYLVLKVVELLFATHPLPGVLSQGFISTGHLDRDQSDEHESGPDGQGSTTDLTPHDDPHSRR